MRWDEIWFKKICVWWYVLICSSRGSLRCYAGFSLHYTCITANGGRSKDSLVWVNSHPYLPVLWNFEGSKCNVVTLWLATFARNIDSLSEKELNKREYRNWNEMSSCLMRLELNCQRILSPSCRMTDCEIYLYLEPRPQLGNLTAQWKYQCQRLKWAPTFFSKLRAKIDKYWWHMVAGSSDATVAAEQLGIYTKDLRNIIPSSKLR